jgi:uncharacterized repeat protein (TIGR03803 family)
MTPRKPEGRKERQGHPAMRLFANAAIVTILVLLAMTMGSTAQAQSFTVLHSFGSGNDGASVSNGLTLDAAGNIYGATFAGGTNGLGTIFTLDVSGAETILYNFTGADGAAPNGGLILDATGTLYGTTDDGGVYGWGTVFKLDANGQETVLHSFPSGPGGDSPVTGLVQDAQGNLFGTTFAGGSSHCGIASRGCGVVFKLDTSGVVTILHEFNGPDGSHPTGPLTQGSNGTLLGTTLMGGAFRCCGVVFRLNSTGKAALLHSFSGSADGSLPTEGVSQIRPALSTGL